MSKRTEEALPTRTSAVVAADMAAAREVLAARESAVQAAQAAYDASLDLGRAEALAAREHLSGAEVDRDIARRTVERLNAEHGAALQGERRASVARVVAEADAAREEYQQAVEDLLPEMGRGARALIRAWALAEIARDAAVAAIRKEDGAEAAQQYGAVEGFRTWPGRPREPLGPPQDQTLWTNAGGVAPGDEWQDRVREQPDGSGLLLNGGGRSVFEHKRTFRTETFLPAQDAVRPDLLVKALAVPGITGADRAGWVPLDFADPQRALEQLDELEKPSSQAEDRRQPQTETNPVGIAVKVSRPAAPFRELRAQAG